MIKRSMWCVGLAVGLLVALGLSIEPALAQAQQQNKCLADLFAELAKRGSQEKQKDFETDRDNATKAIQKAIKAGTLAAGTDTQFLDSVQAIVCHLVATATFPVVKAEQDRRLTEAVAKLRNLFQRIANPIAGADDLKDGLAKLRFAYWALRKKDPITKDYIWHFLRLELPAGGTDIDLVLHGRDRVGHPMIAWKCPGAGPGGLECTGLVQDAIILLKTKDVANAANLLGAPKAGGGFTGGAGSLQDYTALALQYVAANDKTWIQNYYPAGKVSECKTPNPRPPFIPPILTCWTLPPAAFVVYITFPNAVQNGGQVMPALTQDANVLNAAKAVVVGGIAKAKGLIVAWKELQGGAVVNKHECRFINRIGNLLPCIPVTGLDINQFAGSDRIVCELYGERRC